MVSVVSMGQLAPAGIGAVTTTLEGQIASFFIDSH